MKSRRYFITSSCLSALVLFSFLSACTPSTFQSTSTLYPTHGGELTPYWTQTATATSTPTNPATPTPLPSPTPTPVTYTVQKGDDMLSIAIRYKISLDQLKAANPDVDPNFLRIGQVLIIPGTAPQPTAALPTPTPVPVLLGTVHCYPDLDGGAWCFALAQNNGQGGVEGITALIRAADSKGNAITPQIAVTPLNLLPANQSMPLAAYFPAPFPQLYQASIELVTALPVPQDDKRYLMTAVKNQQFELLGQGLSAEVTGDITLQGGSGKASLVWVLAVAYDQDGNVCGFRRWESNQALTAGQSLPFSIRVYSTGAAVDHVDIMVEARA